MSHGDQKKQNQHPSSDMDRENRSETGENRLFELEETVWFHHISRLARWEERQNCPPEEDILSLAQNLREEPESGLTTGMEKARRHTRTCGACLALFQDIQRALTEPGLIANQEEVLTAPEAALIRSREAGGLEVPLHLQNYTSWSLGEQQKSATEKESTIGSLVFRLTADGFRFVRDSLSGNYELSAEAGMALRGAREYNTMTVSQPVSEGKIAYQVFRENEEEVTLSVKLPVRLQEKYTKIKLRKGDRILSSRSFDPQNLLAVFHQLKSGNYTLELFGTSEPTVSVRLALV